MEYLTKELVDTFVYSTMEEDRFAAVPVRINGRDYTKFGTYQAVTLVGNLYNVYDPSVKMYKKILFVGMSKQHPCDTVLSRNVAVEIANENCYTTPIIRMEVDNTFNLEKFRAIMEMYVSSLKLSIVKTREEIIADYGEEELEKYNR